MRPTLAVIAQTDLLRKDFIYKNNLKPKTKTIP